MRDTGDGFHHPSTQNGKMSLNELLLSILHLIISLGTLFSKVLDNLKKPLFLSSYKHHDGDSLHADSKCLRKLPLHVGIVIVEDVCYSDLANIAVWCIGMGVTYISIYDKNGICKRNCSIIHREVHKKQQSLSCTDSTKYDINIHTSRCIPLEGSRTKGRADITLLSMEDGRQELVNVVKQLSRAATHQQIRIPDLLPSKVDRILQDYHGFPDPDLVVRFGPTESMMGFLPWQIRLSEILSLPTHHGVDYKSIYSTIQEFGGTHQRFGK